MTHTLHRLTALGVKNAKTKPGQRLTMLNDGGGLLLRTVNTGGKSWVYRYMEKGQSHDLGLGPLHVVSLVEAREKAAQLRRERFDLSTIRTSPHQQKVIATASAPTFETVALDYIDTHRSEWRNPKTEADYRASLGRHIFPVIGNVPIDQIDTDAVLRALKPIWGQAQGTRIRSKVAAILDAAGAAGHRDGAIPNPARWGGHLEHLLKAADAATHHEAIPYAKLPTFWAALSTRQGASARALRFLILTAVRSGDVRGCTWDQIDFDDAVWSIPMTKEHPDFRVPLSAPAITLLSKIPKEGKTSVYPFRCSATGMGLLMRDRMGSAFVPHGFRSTFSTWANEETEFHPDFIEAALCHFNKDRIAGIYNRGGFFNKRQKLMEEWAEFVISEDWVAA